MFCPSHQLLVNKFVTDFGRSKRPPPLHQVVSKPSGGTLATTVTAAREWSMGVRPGVETGQMRSPPKKNTEKSCGEKYLFLPPQKIRSWFKLVEVWFMTLQMCFCWGLIWHLEWCWRRQPFLHSLPGNEQRKSTSYLTSLNFIPKTAPPMGEMSKIDSKVVGFREAEGSVFLSRNLLELTKKKSFKSHKFLRLTIAGEGELVSGRVASLFWLSMNLSGQKNTWWRVEFSGTVWFLCASETFTNQDQLPYNRIAGNSSTFHCELHDRSAVLISLEPRHKVFVGIFVAESAKFGAQNVGENGG